MARKLVQGPKPAPKVNPAGVADMRQTDADKNGANLNSTKR